MPIRNANPTLPAREVSNRLQRKADQEAVRQLYRKVLIGVSVAHVLVGLAVLGPSGYAASWVALARLTRTMPYLVLLVPVGLIALFKAVQIWKAPLPTGFTLPDYPPVPDLRFSDGIYIGSGYTRRGKQPGDEYDTAGDEDDEMLEEPHLVLPDISLYANIHCLGGVGGGKTSRLILPVLREVISKYPRPPRPEQFRLDKHQRIVAEQAGTGESPTARFTGLLRLARSRGNAAAPGWNPYVGMTMAEATAEFDRLLALHEKKKWAIFCVDPKGDMAPIIAKMAAYYGREKDLVVLRPDGPFSYNHLAANTNQPLVMASLFVEGIESVSGQPIQPYYKQTMTEWLSNALEILRVALPTRVTIKSMLSMARNEQFRSQLVAEAETIRLQEEERESARRRLGLPPIGTRVNPAAIEFFKDWDGEDKDVQRQNAVVSGIKSQAQYFVDGVMSPFLCPELPSTFKGFEDMFDSGKIVCLQVPLGQYGPVAKVLGILMLADAQVAARERVNKHPNMDEERAALFAIDEFANFLNSGTKEFLSINRQSKVSVFGAHQSTGQLAERGKGFEQSLSDNMRTKISFNAPNADAAKRLVELLGGRRVIRERYTESESFQGVQKVAESELFKSAGQSSASRSMSVEEINRDWFDPEDFVGLETGQMIVNPFDGTTTRPPRKVNGFGYWEHPDWKGIVDVPMPDLTGRPHPVVQVWGSPDGVIPKEIDFLVTVCQGAGFAIVSELANASGSALGLRITTEYGTVLADGEILEEAKDALRERLDQMVVISIDNARGVAILEEVLGGALPHVIDLALAYRTCFPHATANAVDEIARAEQPGVPDPVIPRLGAGSWEWHCGQDDPSALEAESRLLLQLYASIGRRIAALDEENEALIQRLSDASRARSEQLFGEQPIEPIDELLARFELAHLDRTALEAVVDPDLADQTLGDLAIDAARVSGAIEAGLEVPGANVRRTAEQRIDILAAADVAGAEDWEEGDTSGAESIVQEIFADPFAATEPSSNPPEMSEDSDVPDWMTGQDPFNQASYPDGLDGWTSSEEVPGPEAPPSYGEHPSPTENEANATTPSNPSPDNASDAAPTSRRRSPGTGGDDRPQRGAGDVPGTEE